MFECINPDNMTYEEILALQERIGFVSKGVPKSQIDRLPKMQRHQLEEYLDDMQMQLSQQQLEQLEEEEIMI
jgi:hypothetical protein